MNKAGIPESIVGAAIVCMTAVILCMGFPSLMHVESPDKLDYEYGRYLLKEFKRNLDRYKEYHDGNAPRTAEEFRKWEDFTDNWSLEHKLRFWERLRYPLESGSSEDGRIAIAAYVHDNGIWQYVYSDDTISP